MPAVFRGLQWLLLAGGGAAALRSGRRAARHPRAHAVDAIVREFQHEGEALFCQSADASACRSSWHFSASLTCEPFCRAYVTERQASHSGKQYAAEACERRTDAACMATCLLGELLGEGHFDAHEKDAGDFIGSFVYASSQAVREHLPAFAAARNTSDATHGEVAKALQGFWETLCASGGDTRYGLDICHHNEPEAGAEGPGAAVHFEYGGANPGASFLQRRSRHLPSVPQFLAELKAPDVAEEPLVAPADSEGATAVADLELGLHLPRHSDEEEPAFVQHGVPFGTSALRQASEVAVQGGAPLVRRWLEACFLGEGRRIAKCWSHGHWAPAAGQ